MKHVSCVCLVLGGVGVMSGLEMRLAMLKLVTFLTRFLTGIKLLEVPRVVKSNNVEVNYNFQSEKLTFFAVASSFV